MKLNEISPQRAERPKVSKAFSSAVRAAANSPIYSPRDAIRTLVSDHNPDDCFIEFPLKEDFEENDREYLVAGTDGWGLAAEIGQRVCNQKLTYLCGARIGYLWKQRGGKRAGNAVLGKAVMASAIVRTFTDRVAFVVLSADHVHAFKLNRWQMEALIYHDLRRFVSDEGVIGTVGHDFEAFKSEVEEYGLWKPDLSLAAEAFKQADLPGLAPA